MTDKKVVLITGSSRGIGRACALEFARAGHSIIINGRTQSAALLQLESEIKALGCDCLSFAGDVSDSVFTDEMVKAALARFSRIDVLINNAGISYVGLLHKMSNEDWHHVLGVNLDAAFYMCRSVLPGMISRKSGSIINISSVWGNVGAACEVAYSASKGALNAFTSALAKETAPSGIAVNAIACGLMDTDMNSCFSTDELADICADIPAGHAGTPADAAKLALMLANAPTYLTGNVIKLDGGWT